MDIAIYPGTFDPATRGHLDIIERGSRICGTLIVAVARNTSKVPIFSVAERIEMLQELTRNMPNVAVDSYEGISVDYARKKKAGVILRGIRTPTDFEYEFQMALTNRTFADDIEIVFIMSDPRFTFMNSALVKEALMLKQDMDISAFVPALVEKALKAKFSIGK